MRMTRLLNLLLAMSLILTACGITTLPTSDEEHLRVGLDAYDRGDYSRALNNLKPLAEHGDTVAQTKLGNMYYLGLGVPENNETAAKWFRKAADQGDLEAQITLGTLYILGVGVDQNYAEAAKLLRSPAEWGISGAQFMLGMLYMNGQGVARDPVQACMWLGLAATGGSKAAIEARAELTEKMTSEQISRARAMEENWKPHRPSGE